MLRVEVIDFSHLFLVGIIKRLARVGQFAYSLISSTTWGWLRKFTPRSSEKNEVRSRFLGKLQRSWWYSSHMARGPSEVAIMVSSSIGGWAIDLPKAESQQGVNGGNCQSALPIKLSSSLSSVRLWIVGYVLFIFFQRWVITYLKQGSFLLHRD